MPIYIIQDINLTTIYIYIYIGTSLGDKTFYVRREEKWLRALHDRSNRWIVPSSSIGQDSKISRSFEVSR